MPDKQSSGSQIVTDPDALFLVDGRETSTPPGVVPPVDWIVGANLRRHGVNVIFVSPEDGRDWGIPYDDLPDEHQDAAMALGQQWAEGALAQESARHDLDVLAPPCIGCGEPLGPDAECPSACNEECLENAYQRAGERVAGASEC